MLAILGPALGAIAGLVALRLIGRQAFSQHEIGHWLQPLGHWAPLAFVLFLAVRPLTLLPGQFFAALAGLMFGTRWGTVFCLVGSFLASVVIFVPARWLGGPLMRRALGGQYRSLEGLAVHHGFRFSLLTCLNPLIPTDVAQALAAASGARFLPVALGTLLGSIPGTLLTTQFGSAVGQGKTILTVVAGAGLLASILLGAQLGRRVLKELRTPKPVNRRRKQRLAWQS